MKSLAERRNDETEKLLLGAQRLAGQLPERMPERIAKLEERVAALELELAQVLGRSA